MGDEERSQEDSSFEFEIRKKKGKRRQKRNLLRETNQEDSEQRDPESEESNCDAKPELDQGETSTKEKIKLVLDGIQIIEGSRWIRTADGPVPAPIDKEAEHEPKIEIEEQKEVLEPFNEKALLRYAATYELEKYDKHALIIFNQEDIDDTKRDGTSVDVEALTNTFERFGFEVKDNIHDNLTKDEIFEKLDEFMKRDYTDYGCVGVAVLTHGSRYGRLRAKDKKYNEIEIINHLKVHNKPTLVTKPKFFILQACRGTKTKPPVPVLQAGKKIQTDAEPDLEPYHLPEEADMLILHSCYIGSPALRHPVNGTWFIQTLCEKIDQLAPTHDLESIITEVKRAVAIDRYSLDREDLPVHTGQIPVLTSTLIRKLYLKKLGDPPPLDTGLVLPTKLQGPSATRKDSRASVLDPSTPLLPHFGPCHCFLDHFNYMRDCLQHFVEDNPKDETACLQLALAEQYDDRVEYNTQKLLMLRILNDLFKNKAKDFEYCKYLYFYNK